MPVASVIAVGDVEPEIRSGGADGGTGVRDPEGPSQEVRRSVSTVNSKWRPLAIRIIRRTRSLGTVGTSPKKRWRAVKQLAVGA
jgi:hypothetical protein